MAAVQVSFTAAITLGTSSDNEEISYLTHSQMETTEASINVQKGDDE